MNPEEMIRTAYDGATSCDPRQMLAELAGEPERAVALYDELADAIDRLSLGMERGDLALVSCLLQSVTLQTLEKEAHGDNPFCGLPSASVNLQKALLRRLLNPPGACCVFTRIAAGATAVAVYVREVAREANQEGRPNG